MKKSTCLRQANRVMHFSQRLEPGLPLDGLRSLGRLHGIRQSLRLMIAMIRHMAADDPLLSFSPLYKLLLVHSAGHLPLPILLNHLVRPLLLPLELACQPLYIPLAPPYSTLRMLGLLPGVQVEVLLIALLDLGAVHLAVLQQARLFPNRCVISCSTVMLLIAIDNRCFFGSLVCTD